jgi:putative serine/threonine protein kinase
LSRQNISFSGEFEIGSPELAGLVCYPRYTEEEYSRRTDELRALGIDRLILDLGGSVVNGIPICGKGCVGLVVKAKMGSGLVALKIRRTDADRKTMEKEASLHQVANRAGVGPRYIGHSENLFAMEFVPGQNIVQWINDASAGRFRKVARSVLEQCFLLDSAGIDHGELSRLGRHVIVAENDSPCIIDFESASLLRKTINVSSAAQSLFLFGTVASVAKKVLPEIDQQSAIAGIRKYKQLRSRESLDELLRILAI